MSVKYGEEERLLHTKGPSPTTTVPPKLFIFITSILFFRTSSTAYCTWFCSERERTINKNNALDRNKYSNSISDVIVTIIFNEKKTARKNYDMWGRREGSVKQVNWFTFKPGVNDDGWWLTRLVS